MKAKIGIFALIALATAQSLFTGCAPTPIEMCEVMMNRTSLAEAQCKYGQGPQGIAETKKNIERDSSIREQCGSLDSTSNKLLFDALKAGCFNDEGCSCSKTGQLDCGQDCNEKFLLVRFELLRLSVNKNFPGLNLPKK